MPAEEVRIFVRNLVYKFSFSCAVDRAMIAMEFGGLYTAEDHAGPTSIRVEGETNAHFRIFKHNKIILTGCKSPIAAHLAIWNFCARTTLMLSRDGIITPVFPVNIEQTNTMSTGYCPFTIDLQRTADQLHKEEVRVIYDPTLINYVRAYYVINDKKITMNIAPSGAVVTMGGNADIIIKAFKKLFPVLKANKITDVDPLLQRKIKIDSSGVEEIEDTDITKKRRKRRKKRKASSQ